MALLNGKEVPDMEYVICVNENGVLIGYYDASIGVWFSKEPILPIKDPKDFIKIPRK